MTKKEAATILAILKAAYPNSYKNMTKEEAMGTVSVWAIQFADMPADIVLMAVHKAISSSPFPPAISEVKNKISALHWEAYSLTDNRVGNEFLSEQEKRQAKRIYDATKEYSYSKCLEPSLEGMLHNADQMLLGPGSTISEGGR